MRVRFGDCVLDTATRELLRGGKPVAISPKAFLLLEALLESRPRALGKAQLHERVWPDTHVAGTSLPRLVNEVRQAIGDDADAPSFVRTVPRFGYAFSGEAIEEAPAAAAASRASFPCALLWGTREVALPEGESFLGRAPDCVVRVVSDQVSRHHAVIRVTGEDASVEDCGSKNGTFVRGRRIDRAVTLEEGDDICIGPVVLTFRGPAGLGPTRTRHG